MGAQSRRVLGRSKEGETNEEGIGETRSRRDALCKKNDVEKLEISRCFKGECSEREKERERESEEEEGQKRREKE